MRDSVIGAEVEEEVAWAVSTPVVASPCRARRDEGNSSSRAFFGWDSAWDAWAAARRSERICW